MRPISRKRRSSLDAVFSFALSMMTVAGLSLTPAHGETPDTAQSLLFDAPYLTEFTPPAILRYRFQHATTNEAAFGEPFEDRITIDIRPSEDQKWVNSVILELFTGERTRTIGPLNNMKGNPLTMLFLERDMNHMRRRAKGAPAFFRNIVRRAMRNAAIVEKTEIAFEGKTHPAKRVTILPFDADNNPPQFNELRKKVYMFTVSQAIPGGIFEIRSIMPDPAGKGAPLVEDSVIYLGKTE